MTKALIALAAILIAATILLIGNGLQNSLLAIRANFEGFSLTITGLLLSIYYVGFIVGCRATPWLVMRVGHIRCFTALASVASTSALIHILIVEPTSWLILRAASGFCFAGLTMIVESWMNEEATNENRGSVLSIYRILDFIAATVGQWLLTIADPKGFALFLGVSILISLSLVPVALTTTRMPRQITSSKLNLKKLFQISPLAAVGATCVGTANGALWAIGPVFVLGIGFGIHEAAAFMSSIILAGALAQWPVGYLSDLVDRRKVLISVSGIACICGLALFFVGAQSLNSLLICAGLLGFFALPMFGLCVAHANDFATADEYVEVNGGLLLLFGIGAVIGPVVASFFMEHIAPSALFLHTAIIHCSLVLYGLYRMTQRAPVPLEEQGPYVPVPRTSPVVFELDPRAPEKE